MNPNIQHILISSKLWLQCSKIQKLLEKNSVQIPFLGLLFISWWISEIGAISVTTFTHKPLASFKNDFTFFCIAFMTLISFNRTIRSVLSNYYIHLIIFVLNEIRKVLALFAVVYSLHEENSMLYGVLLGTLSSTAGGFLMSAFERILTQKSSVENGPSPIILWNRVKLPFITAFLYSFSLRSGLITLIKTQYGFQTIDSALLMFIFVACEFVKERKSLIEQKQNKQKQKQL